MSKANLIVINSVYAKLYVSSCWDLKPTFTILKTVQFI